MRRAMVEIDGASLPLACQALIDAGLRFERSIECPTHIRLIVAGDALPAECEGSVLRQVNAKFAAALGDGARRVYIERMWVV